MLINNEPTGYLLFTMLLKTGLSREGQSPISEKYFTFFFTSFSWRGFASCLIRAVSTITTGGPLSDESVLNGTASAVGLSDKHRLTWKNAQPDFAYTSTFWKQ